MTTVRTNWSDSERAADAVRSAAGVELSAVVRTPDPRDRELFELAEALRELELRLRERVEGDYLREVELRAVQREVEVKAAYIATLETTQGALHAQLAELGALRGALAASEVRLAELGALLATIQHQWTYRAVVLVVRLVRSPLRFASALAKRLRLAR